MQSTDRQMCAGNEVIMHKVEKCTQRVKRISVTTGRGLFRRESRSTTADHETAGHHDRWRSGSARLTSGHCRALSVAISPGLRPRKIKDNHTFSYISHCAFTPGPFVVTKQADRKTSILTGQMLTGETDRTREDSLLPFDNRFATLPFHSALLAPLLITSLHTQRKEA